VPSTVFALANQKGGVGKTTTAVNLAACLADAGERGLVVDLDPQANATSGLGTRANGTSTHDLLDGVPIGQLAKATDLKLRFLAKLDLSSSKSPQEVFDLANQYWDLAEQKADLEEQSLKLRAAFWYSQATNELPAGLDKIKARKRLAQIVEAYGKEETEKATGRRDIAAAAGSASSD
jgi:cellulose biosynthesis protein BcsQ